MVYKEPLCSSYRPFILAHAYWSVISDSSSDHSRCPRYDTRVKTYLDLSASESDTA
jgi:hypothetical protein